MQMQKLSNSVLNMAKQGVTTLTSVENSLNLWLKPKLFGEKWDNVGLLVGSGFYSKESKIINGILLCNDMTPEVVQEAVETNSNLIISYHPPIFSPLKTIAYNSWKEGIISKCLARDISVYSPHTTLDAVSGGINDRVIEALRSFGSADAPTSSLPIIASSLFEKPVTGLKFTSLPEVISSLYHLLPLQGPENMAVAFDVNTNSSVTLRVYSAKKALSCENMSENVEILDAIKTSKVSAPEEADPAPFGAGRIVRFTNPANLTDVIDAVKGHLNLDYAQIAYGGKSTVTSAAVCVGSGASLLKGVRADVYITGEMSHHDILDCVQDGVSVILCGHCSSERHYLPTLQSIVKIVTQVQNVLVSKADKSPLRLNDYQ